MSFVIPFADVVAELAAAGIAGFDDGSPLACVLGSSTQPNALNQDLGGPNGGTTSSQTWAQLGAMSSPTSALPEPASGAFALLALAACAARRRS